MCAIIIEIHKLRTSEAAVRLHIAYYVSNKEDILQPTNELVLPTAN